jgi:excisionase family DNA binding protein
MLYDYQNLQDEFLTRKQVAELCHCSYITIYRWDRAGKIKSYGIGGRNLYKRNEIMHLIVGK